MFPGLIPTDVGPLQGGVPTSFGHDAWWIILVKVVLIFGILLVTTLLTIWGERRIVGRMQQRIGPNRVGPQGVLQGLADGVKLMLKEDILPALRDKPVFFLAPILSAVPAFLAFSVIPFGPVVNLGGGHHTPLQLTDLPVGALFVLACSSLGVYGIVLSGWASGSTYPLLGALRAAAQMISYEVAMGLSLVPVFLTAGSLSTSVVVDSQQRFWYAFALLPSFLIYAVSAVGETNRAPFDNAEGETELVGGFHTEYSSIKFAMFFLAEYINLVTVSALATTLFLGGWKAPFHLTAFAWANNGWVSLIWFGGKTFCFIFGFIWLRGTLPRLRYDQFMKLGWKIMVPIALVWVLVDAFINQARDAADRTPYFVVGGVIVLIVFSYVALDPMAGKRNLRKAEQEAYEAELGADAFPTPDIETIRAMVEGRLPLTLSATGSSADGGVTHAALSAEMEKEAAHG